MEDRAARRPRAFYNRDIQKRGVGLVQKDQDVTINSLEDGFFLVCRWAQCCPGLGPGEAVFLS